MKKLICSVIIIVTIISCKNSKETKVEISETKVTVVKVKTSNITSNFKYSGTIEASQTIPLSFQSTGIVETVLIDAGDVVKKGQLLATTDSKNAQNFADIARAKYEQAKDAYDRLKSVYDKGSLSEIKWVEMETGLDQAKASLEMSKDNLDKCNLYAPCNGIVGKRNIEPGMSSITLLAPIELIEMHEVYVKISVPENEISKLQKGQLANFNVSALDNKNFSGKITNLSPVADAISRTYKVKILVKNQSLELKPGMVCDVNLNKNKEQEIMSIPYSAVSKDSNGKTFVFTVSPDKKSVKKQDVVLGNYCDSGIEVISGLNPNQIIVVEGKEKLSNNSLISL